MKVNRSFRRISSSTLLAAVFAGTGLVLLPCDVLAQTPPAEAAAEPQQDTSPAGLIELIKKSPKPDEKVIAALENYLSVTTLPAEAATTVAPAISESALDSETLVQLLSAFGPDPQNDAVAVATMTALARNGEKEVADPAKVEPILKGLLKTQPIMSKIAWRGDTNRLKLYGDVLAVYIDHCPADNEALQKKLNDMRIRQITAARFKLEPEKAIERVTAIDASKLTREKDRDQLNYLIIEIYDRAKEPQKALDAAKTLWARPNDTEFRSTAWPVIFEDLRSQGKTTEASALLDEAATQYGNSTEVANARQKLADTPATQPAPQ